MEPSGTTQFMKLKIEPLHYSYIKPDGGIWVLNYDDIPVNKEFVQDEQLVHFAPGSVGGNHRHPRREWFIGIGDLVFIWLDNEGKVHQEEMNPGGQIMLISVPPHLPHAVANLSEDRFGILYEMADGKMKDGKAVKVYESK